MFHAPRRPDVLVAAEDDEGIEPVVVRAIGVGHAVLRRVLARQEGDDVRARDVAAEIDDQVPEVVFFLQPYGAVGQEHEGPRARQSADRVVRVDPRVHARGGFQLRAGRTQLGCNHRRAALQLFDQSAHPEP